MLNYVTYVHVAYCIFGVYYKDIGMAGQLSSLTCSQGPCMQELIMIVTALSECMCVYLCCSFSVSFWRTQGGREVKDFVDFIKKKSTLDVKVEGGKKKKSKEDL